VKLLLVLFVALSAAAQDAPQRKPAAKPAAKRPQIAHSKATPEQIRKFNQLEKQQKK
jgi:hypothetical protein